MRRVGVELRVRVVRGAERALVEVPHRLRRLPEREAALSPRRRARRPFVSGRASLAVARRGLQNVGQNI